MCICPRQRSLLPRCRCSAPSELLSHPKQTPILTIHFPVFQNFQFSNFESAAFLLNAAQFIRKTAVCSGANLENYPKISLEENTQISKYVFIKLLIRKYRKFERANSETCRFVPRGRIRQYIRQYMTNGLSSSGGLICRAASINGRCSKGQK